MKPSKKKKLQKLLVGALREQYNSKKEFLALAMRQFKLGIGSEHGISHWKRVEEIGQYLAQHTKADSKIIYLFSYLHDLKRENEDYDSEHGLRASSFVKELYNKDILYISKEQLIQLTFACEHHNNSKIKSDDITIQTCWDADRLDLWRVGVMPDPYFLNTAIAKQEKTIEFSRKLNKKLN